MKKLSDKARMYARSYGQPPYGKEIEGTAELLLRMAEKLDKYEDLEEKGRLIKLPCAVGDTVYEVQDFRKRIQPYVIIAVHISNCGNQYEWDLKDGKGIFSNVSGFSEYDLGESVFLSLEEAEATLKAVKS